MLISHQIVDSKETDLDKAHIVSYTLVVASSVGKSGLTSLHTRLTPLYSEAKKSRRRNFLSISVTIESDEQSIYWANIYLIVEKVSEKFATIDLCRALSSKTPYSEDRQAIERGEP